MKLSHQAKAFLSNDDGATAIEYCMIGAAMCICLLASMPSLTTALTGRYSTIGTAITTIK